MDYTTATTTVVRVDDFGLCEVAVEEKPYRRRAGFTLNKLVGYRGQSAQELGIRVGAKVILEECDGRVKSARLIAEARSEPSRPWLFGFLRTRFGGSESNPQA